MAKQLYDNGDTLQAGTVVLECTGASYLEENGERVKYSYVFRVKSELDAERAEAKRIEDEQTADVVEPDSEPVVEGEA